MSFWGELRRRNVVKVAAAYLVASWLIVQIVGTLTEPLNLPDVLDTVVVVLLTIGFPFALVFAWVYDVTPEGIKVTSDVDDSGGAPSSSGKRLTYFVIAMLVIAMGLMAVENYLVLPSSGEFGAGSRLAVLPCDDLSPDPTNSFFAVGIHEELLNRLAALSALEVISRTSVQRYSTRRPPIRQIASELNADAIMECSARYAGDRVLLTAQLIDGSSDTHLWSQSYPAYMSNLQSLFEIQAELAMDVANALHVTFFEDEREQIERISTQSREAYELYLAAQPGPFCGQCNPRAIELLDQALQIDEGFVEAWIKKSFTHSTWYVASGGAADLADAMMSAERAIDLAPDRGNAYAARATVFGIRGDWLDARSDYQQAQSRGFSPAPDSRFLMSVGDFERALVAIESTLDSDPLSGGAFASWMLSQEVLGNQESADELFRRGERLFGQWLGDAFRVWILLGRGEVGPGFEELELGGIQAQLAELLDDRVEALALLNTVSMQPSSQSPSAQASLAVWAAYFGDSQLALRLLRQGLSEYGLLTFMAWLPVFDELRQLAEFKELVIDIGLVDYWRASDWPDVCRPVGDDDFECS